ncbi:TolC family protein [Pandoraea apista]
MHARSRASTIGWRPPSLAANEHGNGAGNAGHWRASISWFLLDFGSRGALLDRARSRLAVAMALRDARFQQVIFDVARAYYSVQEA